MKRSTNNHIEYPRLIKEHFRGKGAELSLRKIFSSNHYECQKITTEIKIFPKRKSNNVEIKN